MGFAGKSLRVVAVGSLVLWVAVIAYALAYADAPDPDMPPYRRTTDALRTGVEVDPDGQQGASTIAGGLTFKQTAVASTQAPEGVVVDDDDADGMVSSDDGGQKQQTTTNLMESVLPVVSLIWTAELFGILLNLLLLCLYSRLRLKTALSAAESSSDTSFDVQWQLQLRNSLACWGLVPFCMLILCGYRVWSFVTSIESTQHLRNEAVTMFSRGDDDCSPSQSGSCKCIITAVHHTVRVVDNHGLTDCEGTSSSNAFLRLGAGSADDIEGRCQGQYGDVKFTFDDYTYSFNYSGHTLKSRGESFLRPFKGTRMAVSADQHLWVDHPKKSKHRMPSTYAVGESVTCWKPEPDKIDLATRDPANRLGRDEWRDKFQCGNALCVKIFDPATDLQDPEWHPGELLHIMMAVCASISATLVILFLWCCCVCFCAGSLLPCK